MKNKFLVLGVLSLLCLTGCNQNSKRSQKTSSTASQETDNQQIKRIYELYRTAGGEMSYEEWLETIKGEKGDPGQNGQNGTNGQDGTQILTGTSSPTNSIGKSGDIYINTSNWDFYKKNGSSWTLVGNLKGSDGAQGNVGPQGPQGQPGQDGTCVRTGNGAPSSSLGTNGDSYIDLLTWNYYVKQNNNWVFKGNIKGDNGPQGSTGVSVVSTTIDQNGDLIVEFSNGDSMNAGHIVDTQVYTVSFHVDDEIIATRNVIKGNTVSRPTNIETAGYTIHDWYTKDGSYMTSWNFQGCVVTRDIDLWADFDYDQYKISFSDPRFNNVVADLYVLYDHEYNLPQLAETGYTFTGWKYSDAIIPNSGIYRYSKDINLTAVWDAKKYNVSLDTNGGILDVDSIEVTYDAEYLLPTPTKIGFTFTGWYEDGHFFSSKSVWKYDEDKSLVATWTNVSMTFTFDPGEGSCDTESMVILYGDEYTLPNAIRDGYFFKGWKLNSVLLKQNGIWTYSTEGAVLIADWVETGFDFNNDLLSFGYYPQSRVDDTSVISELNKLTTPDKYDWYYYKNNYYAKVTAPSTSLEGDFIKGETYWFLVEKILWWKYETAGNKIYYTTWDIIDSVVYYGGSYKEGIASYSYTYSHLRAWLTGDFYNSALELGKEYLNSKEMTCIDYSSNGNNTTSTISDNVYVKDLDDLNLNECSMNNPTDYLRCKGSKANGSVSNPPIRYQIWTRNPYVPGNAVYAYYTRLPTGPGTTLQSAFSRCGVRPSIILSKNI